MSLLWDDCVLSECVSDGYVELLSPIPIPGVPVELKGLGISRCGECGMWVWLRALEGQWAGLWGDWVSGSVSEGAGARGMGQASLNSLGSRVASRCEKQEKGSSVALAPEC